MDRRQTPASGINVQLLIVLGAVALVAVLYWPTSVEIADLWEDTIKRRYTHGWLVLAVSVWLVWRDRAYLASIPRSPAAAGWLLPAFGSLLWLVGYHAGLQAVTTLGMPLLVLAAIWAAGGLALARRVAFPVLLLYFALPAWEFFNWVLQWLTAVTTHALAGLVGIPVVMDELVIHIPAGSFYIAGGCSGMHFFIVALYIATLQGELDRDHWRSRVLLLLIAGALALVTNWLRVFIIIVAGHLSNMQHFLVKVDHYYFGWVLFAFAFVLYFYLTARVIPRHGARVRPIATGVEAPAGRRLAAVVLTVVALAAGPLRLLAQAEPAQPDAPQPPTVAGWSGPVAPLTAWLPVFVGADAVFQAAYRSEAGDEVVLYHAVYHSQRQGKELLGFENSVLGQGLRSIESAALRVAARGEAVAVTETVAEAPHGATKVIWSLYATDGRPNSMSLPNRLLLGLRAVHRPPSASVIAMAAECRPDCDAAREVLGKIGPPVLSSLLAAPPGRGAAPEDQGQ